MKTLKHTLALTVTVLYTSLAYAGGHTDEISASFERDINRESSALAVASISGEADPVNAFINTALSIVPGTDGGAFNVAWNASQDPVLASFERDINREPPEFAVASIEGDADPVNTLINAALGAVSDPVLASFVRDLYHDPSAFKAALARGETDPMGAFKSAVSSVKKQERLTMAFTTA